MASGKASVVESSLPIGAFCVLAAACLGTFLINWYLSILLSSFAAEIAGVTIGLVIAGMSLFGVLGALLFGRLNLSPKGNLQQLFVLTSLACPSAIYLHTAIGFDSLKISATAILLVGFITGAATALIGKAKYMFTHSKSYLAFHQRLVLVPMLFGLLGATVGPFFAQHSGSAIAVFTGTALTVTASGYYIVGYGICAHWVV
ncbi:MAG: hypothetical protein KZQ81_13715 [Candidatus Thiodiazotropha sp. (ex Rostrolucina anterorostrata)]|nr:hypothetical protein [Candidatus Thiodiazotropha sp. (ex Rostrolucina anterorostrata)]